MADYKPWQAQRGENARDYLYFQVYLEREYAPKYKKHLPRSLKEVAEFMGCPTEEVRRVAARWDWEERAREYDLSHVGKKMRGEVATPEELALRRRKLLSDNLDMLEEAVSLVKEQVRSGKAPRMDLAKLLDVTLHYQDRALEAEGGMEERLGQDWNLDSLSDEELELLTVLQKKASRR